MKKILPYILIVFTLVNFLAPVSVGLSSTNRIVVERKVANASSIINVALTASRVGNTVIGDITAEYFDTNNGKAIINFGGSAGALLFDQNPGTKDNRTKGVKPIKFEKAKWNSTEETDSSTIKTGTVKITDLEENKTYYILAYASQADISSAEIVLANIWELWQQDSKSGWSDQPLVVTITDKTKTEILEIGTTETTNPEPLPACSILGYKGTFMGCVAQVFYYVLFVPTSYLFALAGNFFDWAFAYSVNDASYRSGFVIQGWGVIRDFCNIFFIFILLYIAFQVILGINGSKTKEMVMHVVIIGLLINFSLFATQVIIDASNILARVFYSSNTIVITEKGSTAGSGSRLDNNTTNNGATPEYTNGIIPLSSALVNKVNPQNLIINARKVGDVQKEGNADAATDKGGTNLKTGPFIIVTLLATAVNVVGLLVFLSVALVFVSRVIGLWIAMILSPLVFFTYMVPGLDGMDRIGWKKWWPETLKLAFLAPVFIFFLYIILKFLETDLIFMTHNAKETGVQWVVATVVPFVFIMVLLNEAKKLAKDMSGKTGQMITDGLSKVGGFAVGAAAGIGGLAGRQVIGRLASKVGNSEGLKEKAKERGLGGWTARRTLEAANYGSKASYDARNIPMGEVGKTLAKETGIKPVGGFGKKYGEKGFKGVQEKKMKRDTESSELMKQSIQAGAQQDAEAKKWNDEYMAAMLDKRTATEARGELFVESDFKKQYEAGRAEDKDGNTIGKKRILTSDEINRARFSDRASEIEYGPSYLTDREVEKARVEAAGGIFDENEFKKSLDVAGRKRILDERQTANVKELKKKGMPEKTPLSVVDKDNANKAIAKATKSFEHAKDELVKITDDLDEISKFYGYSNEQEDLDENGNIQRNADGSLMMKRNISAEDLTKKDIEAYINRTDTEGEGENERPLGWNKKLAEVNSTITELTSKINKRTISETERKTLKESLVKANTDREEYKQKINDLNSLLNNKRTQENIKKDSSRTINDNSDILNRKYK